MCNLICHDKQITICHSIAEVLIRCLSGFQQSIKCSDLTSAWVRNGNYCWNDHICIYLRSEGTISSKRSASSSWVSVVCLADNRDRNSSTQWHGKRGEVRRILPATDSFPGIGVMVENGGLGDLERGFFCQIQRGVATRFYLVNRKFAYKAH